MADQVRRTKTLHYKRAVIVGAQNATNTLASYLSAALAAKALPMSRMERLGDSSDQCRMINRCYEDKNMISGRFLDFTDGGSQAVLQLDPKADELQIKHMLPTKSEQYLEGILTFGIRANHVIIVGSKGLRAGHLEAHLNWLLTDHAKVMVDGEHVILEDAPKQEVRDKLKEVDWIEFTATVPASVFRATPAKAPEGFVENVITKMREFGGGLFLENLSAKEALKVEDVELKMMIKRKGRRSAKRKNMLDEIAHNLRNADDVDFVLKTKYGEYRAGELKLRVDRPLPMEGTKYGATHVPELRGTALVMQEVLAEFVNQRRIED